MSGGFASQNERFGVIFTSSATNATGGKFSFSHPINPRVPFERPEEWHCYLRRATFAVPAATTLKNNSVYVYADFVSLSRGGSGQANFIARIPPDELKVAGTYTYHEQEPVMPLSVATSEMASAEIRFLHSDGTPLDDTGITLDTTVEVIFERIHPQVRGIE